MFHQDQVRSVLGIQRWVNLFALLSVTSCQQKEKQKWCVPLNPRRKSTWQDSTSCQDKDSQRLNTEGMHLNTATPYVTRPPLTSYSVSSWKSDLQVSNKARCPIHSPSQRSPKILPERKGKKESNDKVHKLERELQNCWFPDMILCIKILRTPPRKAIRTNKSIP